MDENSKNIDDQINTFKISKVWLIGSYMMFQGSATNNEMSIIGKIKLSKDITCRYIVQEYGRKGNVKVGEDVLIWPTLTANEQNMLSDIKEEDEFEIV